MKHPQAFLLSVGDELVSGRRSDANGRYLGHVLESLGCEVAARVLLPDDEEQIAGAVASAMAGGPDVVLLSGGLGPTDDDRTRSGVARGLGIELELDEALLERIEHRYRDRGRGVPEGARRQAFRPAESQLVGNLLGAAPGFVLERGRTLIAALPGVPRETRAAFERGVLPLLRNRLSGSWCVRERALHVVGLSESDVSRLVFEVLSETPELRVSMLATAGEVEVRINRLAADAEDCDAELERHVEALRTKLGHHVYGEGDVTLVDVVREALARAGYRLAAAESCTGGMVGKTITDVPGASTWFPGSIVAYDDAIKESLLGVPRNLLESYGAVSPEVAAALAKGARLRLGAEVGLATTGIAGPSGGSTDKPVGLVYLAVATPSDTVVVRQVLNGDREAIRRWSAKLVLDLARRVLTGLPPLGERVERSESLS
jgi:nicotinamide-nucleotide amidase